ncbi:MAG TPA: 30S ribosomal protein S6 [Phycisphaerae bacterium]|nr:30S ribosomal protein S6 [Phycisphaerae bacterium]
MNQYEAMFLFDPTFAADLGAAKAEVQRILERAHAEIVFLERWEERKLAYEIKGRKRGVYVLCYFKCDGARVAGIERDARLSEPTLRALVRRAEGVSLEQIERFMPAARRADESSEDEGGAPRRSRQSGDGDERDRKRSDERDGERRREPAAVAVAESNSSKSEEEEEE